MKIINLTQHPITVILEDGTNIYETEGTLRLSTDIANVKELQDGTPITEMKFGKLIMEPPIIEGTIYIVSSIVCNANRNRDDFYIPTQLVRTEDGKRVLGCRSLSRNPFSTNANLYKG